MTYIKDNQIRKYVQRYGFMNLLRILDLNMARNF